MVDMAGTDVKTVTMQFMDFVEYIIRHAPLLRSHKEFGDKMRDIRFEIGELEEKYSRILLAANGRGMVSEMLNKEEEYFDAIMASYPKHCEHGYNGLCPTCDAMQTPPESRQDGHYISG
jgi:hypothetical protein